MYFSYAYVGLNHLANHLPAMTEIVRKIATTEAASMDLSTRPCSVQY